MVLQALEGLSDRAACARLQTDVAWKAAAGLALTDGDLTRCLSSKPEQQLVGSARGLGIDWMSRIVVW
jgi:hypothetical protein